MGESLKVLHVIADLDSRSGGTARAVADLSSALALEPDVDVAVMFQSRPDREQVPTEPAVRRISVVISSRWARISGVPFRRALIAEVQRTPPDVIHLHGLWLPLCHWAASLAVSRRIPLVIQPHGMLEPWAVNHKAWRKRLSMLLYQRRDLQAAAMLVASTEREMESFRGLGLKNEVTVIPHGIDGAGYADSQGSRMPRKRGLRTVLFLSRLHPVKGLPTLLRAWSEIDRSGWRLLVVGPDEGGHLQQLRNLAEKLAVAGDVRFVGEVQGQDKASIFQSADVFVLPTQSENFGIVIAEALSYGIPVITTRAAPWGGLEASRCGWWIEQGVPPLAEALISAMALTDDARRAMGARGREFARKFQWGNVAADLVLQYKAIASGAFRQLTPRRV